MRYAIVEAALATTVDLMDYISLQKLNTLDHLHQSKIPLLLLSFLFHAFPWLVPSIEIKLPYFNLNFFLKKN